MSKKHSESDFTKRVTDQLRPFGFVINMVVYKGMNTSGTPDRYFHSAWWRGWLEFKAAKGRLSDLQKATIHSLNKHCPCTAFVIREAVDGHHAVETETGAVLGHFRTGKELVDLLHTLYQQSIQEGWIWK